MKILRHGKNAGLYSPTTRYVVCPECKSFVSVDTFFDTFEAECECNCRFEYSPEDYLPKGKYISKLFCRRDKETPHLDEQLNNFLNEHPYYSVDKVDFRKHPDTYKEYMLVVFKLEK